MIGLFTKYEIYKFYVADDIAYFTSGAKPVTVGDDIYTPKVIDRSDIESSGEMEKNEVNITFPITDLFAQDLQGDFLERTTLVEIFERRMGLTRFLFRGRLTRINPSDAEITLVFETEYTELQAIGNRLKYQRTCPYVLYQAGCNLNKDDFAIRTTAKAENGLKLTVRLNGLDDAYLNMGMITNSLGRLIGIETQIGSELSLMNISSFELISDNDLAIAEALVITRTEDRDEAQEDYDQSVIDYNEAILEYDAKVILYNEALDYLNSLDPSDPDYPAAEQAVADALVEMNDAEQEATDKANDVVDKFDLLETAKQLLQEAIDAIPYIYVYPGCNKVNTTCKDKFDNLDNFGGFPYIPNKNPTSRSMV